MQRLATPFVSAASVSSLLTTTEAVITDLPKDDAPAFPPGDIHYSQFKRSHITVTRYPNQRSQQSKGYKNIHFWTEWKPRAAKFNPKMARKALWVDGWSTPACVKARLKLITQGRLQSRARYGTRDWSHDTAQGNRLPKGNNGKINTVSTNAKDLRHIGKGGGGSRHTHSAGSTSEALAVVKDRLQRGVTVNSYLYLDVLRKCSKQKDHLATKKVHDCIIESGMDKNCYVMNALLDAYIKCGALLDARPVFDELEKKDVVAWNMMIGGYGKKDDAESAMELFKLMRQAGARPNEITYVCILKACASPLALKWGKEVHVCIRHAGFVSDVRVGTALLQMYAKCGCITEAKRVFDDLTNRNFVTWSVMIGAYAASGNVDDARLMFDRMQKRDLITWNIMIRVYAESGRGVEAYRLFLEMGREGFEPDAITYVSILNASASAGALDWVKEVHGHARKAGLESDLRVGNALVHMYAKSGSLDDARLMFDRLKTLDVITWNIMIGAYAERGRGEEAYRLFCQMRREGLEPDAITFTSILNASGSAGASEWVKEVHGHASEAGLELDLRVGSALVHMYKGWQTGET